MEKAILIGNGVTSQLIDDYRDDVMIDKLKIETGEMYDEIDNLLDPYRKLKIKEDNSVIKLLSTQFQGPENVFETYFKTYGLMEELNKEHITSIETLLKVVHLFHQTKKFNYDKVKICANKIYYNDGKNGIDSINKMNFDICKFKRYINEFDFIFTTNYDHILDDAFIKEVCHLHGGYNYKEEGDSPQKIIKVNNVLSYRDAYLIWGINEEEKRNGIRNTKFTRYEMDDKLNVSFDLEIADSVLKGYFDQLKNGEYAEIHIWGYSGLNDGHINKAIDENVNLKKVYYYVAPGDVDSRKIFEKKNSLYNSKQNHIIKLRSWDDIWNEFIN